MDKPIHSRREPRGLSESPERPDEQTRQSATVPEWAAADRAGGARARAGWGRSRRAKPPWWLRGRRAIDTPKRIALIILLAMGMFAALGKGVDTRALSHLGIGLGTGWAVDFVIDLVLRHRRWVSDGGLVTGVIVAMVLGSMTPGYIVAVTTAIALVAKHVLRWRRKPVFNPAGVGLLVANYGFLTMQNWWGGMSLLPDWTLLVLGAGGLYVAWRVKKIPQVVAFLASYAGACCFLSLAPRLHMEALYGLENPMLNSALFLAFFMLTDPPTSPAQPRHQVWFGVLVGLVSVGVYIAFPAELSYLLIGLLAGNLVQFVHAQWRRAARGSMLAVRAASGG